jgi:hypothetical protein
MLRLSPEEFRQAAQNQVSQNINSRFGQWMNFLSIRIRHLPISFLIS